jgi:hypothetical protein
VLDNSTQERTDIDPAKPGVTRKTGRRSLLNRSAITNGTQLLAFVDERSAYARRFRDVLAELIADQGGEASSAGTKALARRAACLIVELELMESKFATVGEASPRQIDCYARAAGALKRLFDVLGTDRKAGDITPDLHHLIDLVEAGKL